MTFLLTRMFVLIVAFSLAGVAHAANGGFFAGYVGRTTVDDNFGFDPTDTSFRLGGGYRFNPHLAVEAYYADLGDPTEAGLTLETTAIVVQLVGFAPIGSTDFFGKIGLAQWEAELCLNGSGCVDDDGADVVFGVGVAFNINRQTSLRLEYEAGEINFLGVDIDHETIMVGFTFSF